MFQRTSSAAALLCLLASTSSAVDLLDPAHFSPNDVITRDVAIVGGGSSGTYSAVRLRDNGKSVVVIEQQDELGGHAETYTDPVTGTTIDLGVVVFGNLTVVTDYFKRFNIPLMASTGFGASSETYVDFTTGETLKNYVPPNDTAVGEAFAAYSEQLAKYPSLQNSFNTTYPLASDLLLPFGEFVKKHNLEAMMPTVFVTNQGYSPLLNITTIYMIKQLNAQELASFGSVFLTTANHDIHSLYVAAAKFLGELNVLLNSSVVAMDRSKTPVRILVSTPRGYKLILAKKLLSAIPPIISNLHGFDLVPSETSLFSKFFYNGYYTGLLNNSDIVTEETGIIAASAHNLYHIPSEPGIYSISLVDGTTLSHVYFASATPLTAEEVQDQIQTAIDRYRQKQGLPPKKNEWAVFKSHVPFNLQVPAEDVADKFYVKLYALNGQRNTFWTGAAFQTQASTNIWQFCELYTVPIILESLG